MSKLVTPTYAHGFARSAGESENPGLFPCAAWMPSFGSTGDKLFDVAGSNGPAPVILSGYAWGPGFVTFTDGTKTAFSTGVTQAGLVNYTPRGWAVVVRFRTTSGFPSFDVGTLFGVKDSVVTVDLFRLALNGDEILNIFHKVENADRAITGSAVVNDGEWHVVVFTENAAASQLWLDGSFEAENTTVVAANVATGVTDDFIIGSYNNSGTPSNDFAGDISDVLLFDHSLTPNEVGTISADPLAPFRLKRRSAWRVPVVGGFQPAWANNATQIAGVLP